MKSLSWFGTFLFAALAASCAPSLDLPPPPDIEPVIESLNNPSADVVADTMAEVADDVETAFRAIEDSEFYLELLDVIVETQEELDEAIDENGDLEVGGVVFPTPNGAVDINFVCEGWDVTQTSPEPENGNLELNMTLAQGSIGPLVWGGAEACKFLTEFDSATLEVSFDGRIGVYFGEVLSPSQNIYELPITFIIVGTLTTEGVAVPVDQAFEVTFAFDEDGNPSLSRLELLVILDDGLTFVYFFETDVAQGLIDATGTYDCSLEERRCTSPSGSFSW